MNDALNGLLTFVLRLLISESSVTPFPCKTRAIGWTATASQEDIEEIKKHLRLKKDTALLVSSPDKEHFYHGEDQASS